MKIWVLSCSFSVVMCLCNRISSKVVVKLCRLGVVYFRAGSRRRVSCIVKTIHVLTQDPAVRTIQCLLSIGSGDVEIKACSLSC